MDEGIEVSLVIDKESGLVTAIGKTQQAGTMTHSDLPPGVFQEDVDFLEHFGVKGMKWGVRRTARIQKRLDRTARVRDGQASTGDKIKTAAIQGVYTKKGARRVLRKGDNIKKTVKDGDAKVIDILLKVQGVRIRDLDYHQKD